MKATKRAVLTLAATVAFAGGVAGCGSSSGGSGGSSSGSSTAAGASSSSMSSGSMSPGSMSSSPMTSGSAGAPTSAAAPVNVTIKDFKFDIPGPVAPGAKVTVTNKDSTNHTFTLKAAGVDVKVQAQGGTATFTAPAKPGSYKVTCDYHANMMATLTVK